ncbi:sensor histidine kinase [Auraticoccus monumenti]|nr:ATP-binding protein [Auraticoccus monumenti]
MTTDARPPARTTVSARLRIVGWIVLTTIVTLISVLVTARSLLLAEVYEQANAGLVQEVEEFRRFASEGRDPETSQPYSDVAALMNRYFDRQALTADEVLVAVTERQRDRPVYAGSDGVLGYRVTEDADLLDRVLADPRASGAETLPSGGPLQWAKVRVQTQGDVGTLVVMQFVRGAEQQVERTVSILLYVAIGAVLLTASIAWFVAGQILRPVRQVRQVAADITEHDLSQRVPVTGNDDIAALATTFNDMLDRLESAYDSQRRFLDDASHELRTPITIIRGHLELLSDDERERAGTLRLVDDELSRMGRIVSDLLLLAKAEQSDFVTPQPTDTADLLLDIEAKCQTLGARNWQLVRIAEGHVALDRQRITQAMLQLAANAVQYSPEGSRVQVGSEFEGEGPDRLLRLWIADQGPGVRPEELTVIFDRFRVGSARQSADVAGPVPRSGAGLGLSIVRTIAEAHGGTAFVQSTPGHGARFGVLVPAAELVRLPGSGAPATADHDHHDLLPGGTPR